jgi:hypothetical protein
VPDDPQQVISGVAEAIQTQLDEVRVQQTAIADTDQPPLVFGQVISFGGADGDYLLQDPHNEISGIVWVPVGTPVDVLREGKGSSSYGSGEWYEVRLADPNDPQKRITGWLPVEVIVPVEPPPY